MGYTKHDAIVVTTSSVRAASEAHDQAIFLRLTPTGCVQSPTNGYISFVVAPDGSKEEWAESQNGDLRRAKFIQWMRDSEWHFDFVAVSYGGDEPENTHIVTHSGQGYGEQPIESHPNIQTIKTRYGKMPTMPKKAVRVRKRAVEFVEQREQPEKKAKAASALPVAPAASLCQSCMSVRGTAELHECPYRMDIHDDHSCSCNCCPACEHECCMDI